MVYVQVYYITGAVVTEIRPELELNLPMSLSYNSYVKIVFRVFQYNIGRVGHAYSVDSGNKPADDNSDQWLWSFFQHRL